MHFLRRFLVFIQKYVYYHFIFPKINKRGGWNKSGGLENFSKINKRGGGTIIRYSRVAKSLFCLQDIIRLDITRQYDNTEKTRK